MEPEQKKESLWEVVRFALITLAIVIPIRMYIAQPFIVSGASMDPTFKDGQYLIVDELSYNFTAPARGDVIIFKFPKDETKYFIKRIIGLPGETVRVSNGQVTIEKDGKITTLDETYVANDLPANVTEKLSADQYFVMGDNRPVSYDSRMWGPVDKDLIKGRAFVRLLPLTKIGVFPGEHSY